MDARDDRKPQIRFVKRPRVGDGQFKLELAVGVRKIAFVQIVDGDVAAVALCRRVERELDLPATERLISAKMLPVE